MSAITRAIRTFAERVLGPTKWATLLHRTGRLNKSSYYDRLTELIIRQRAKIDGVFIDVGCHGGDILRVMMQEAPAATFLAFEPIPEMYADLVKEFESHNVQLYNLALSNSAGVTTFNHVLTNPAYSGLRRRQYETGTEEISVIEVKTDALDSVLDAAGISKVNLIKVDVEGAEWLVLEGAEKAIKRSKPVIIFEHGLGGADCYGKGPEDLYELLVMICGMRISLLHDYLLNRAVLTREGFVEQFHQGLNFYFVAHA
jgi:FkbM family methyltransferase